MTRSYLAGLMAFMSITIGTVGYAGDKMKYNFDDDDTIIITLSSDDNPKAAGKVKIENEPSGVDSFKLKVKGLKQNARYSVFLTNSATAGALPAQFLGEFKTNRKGKGRFRVRTEIVNAFASANEMLEDDNGIADIMGAGMFMKGATHPMIPLNWIRIYLIPPDNMGGNVFGGSENEPGGPLALTSDEALP